MEWDSEKKAGRDTLVHVFWVAALAEVTTEEWTEERGPEG